MVKVDSDLGARVAEIVKGSDIKVSLNGPDPESSNYVDGKTTYSGTDTMGHYFHQVSLDDGRKLRVEVVDYSLDEGDQYNRMSVSVVPSDTNSESFNVASMGLNYNWLTSIDSRSDNGWNRFFEVQEKHVNWEHLFSTADNRDGFYQLNPIQVEAVCDMYKTILEQTVAVLEGESKTMSVNVEELGKNLKAA